jgi:hypothetical protein
MHLNFEGDDDSIVTEIAIRVLCLITNKENLNKKFELCFPNTFFIDRFQDHITENRRHLLYDLDFYANEKRVIDSLEQNICVITTHFYKHLNSSYKTKKTIPSMTVFIGNEDNSINFAIFACNSCVFPVKYWKVDKKTEEELCLEILSCLTENDSILPKINYDDENNQITNNNIIIEQENV